MRKTLLTILVCMLFIFTACSAESKETTTVPEKEIVDVSQTEAKSDSGDMKIVEKEGLFVDTVSFGDGEKLYGEIKKYKSTSKAEVNSIFAINDSDEVIEFFDKKMYAAPFMVNIVCKLMEVSFFDPDKLAEMNAELNTGSNSSEVSKSEMFDYLEGYTVTKFTLNFIDEEDKKQIATCSSTGKDSLDFKAYRDYPQEQSFFGAVIGKETTVE